jgi:hypothetical protein
MGWSGHLQVFASDGVGGFRYLLTERAYLGPRAFRLVPLAEGSFPHLITALGPTYSTSLRVHYGRLEDERFERVFYHQVAGHAVWLEAADLDRNGSLDLACAADDSSAVSVLLNLRDGRLEPRSRDVDVGTGLTCVVALDLDGDGVLELAAGFAEGVAILRAAAVALVPDCNRNGVPDDCETDCDENGVPDDCDVAAGAADCNGNGIPEVCELGDPRQDCNHNGVVDSCDLSLGISLDCDANTRPDECDRDCNQNGVPDACDLVRGTSPDCDESGVPDECELAYRDCDADGVPDPCEIASGEAEDCNRNGVPDACDLAGGVGLRLRRFAFGSAAAQVEAADLDRDGYTDLVLRRGQGLEVLPGRGDGSFAAAIEVPLTEPATRMAIADFDEDEVVDAVVTFFDSQEVALLLGDGSGGFRAGPVTSTEFEPRLGAAADLDGDGDVDLALVAGDDEGELRVLLNDGGGLFDAGERHSLVGSPGALSAADFDGDGDLDLAAALGSSDGAFWAAALLWNRGDGSFADGPLSGFTWGFVTSLEVADVNGDGEFDLAAGVRNGGLATTGSVWVVLQSEGGGGLLEPEVVEWRRHFPNDIGVLDADADGDFDILVLDTRYSDDVVVEFGADLEVLLNAGDGTFAAGPVHRVGLNPRVLATADLDGHGLEDVAVSTGQGLAVLLNYAAPYSADEDGDRVPDECTSQVLFHRGDPNSNGAADIADAVFIFAHLFLGGPEPQCREAADVDNDDAVDVSDGIALLGYLFLGGAAPSSPGPPPATCGADPDPLGAAGDLGCAGYGPCADF